MADIRIKDLATTASTTASDDFMAVDGTTNGTRKLSAATPSFATSVTVPGVVGPTSTALTLTGGTSGASLVLGHGTSGHVVLTPQTSGVVQINPAGTRAPILDYYRGGVVKWEAYVDASDVYTLRDATNGVNVATLNQGAASAATFKIVPTTASTSTTSGALQVAGGVGVSGAGFFGGTLSVTGVAAIGTSTDASTALDVRGALTGASQYGIAAQPVFSSGATSSGSTSYFQMRTAVAAYTMATGTVIEIPTPAIGATSAVTTLKGISIANQGAASVTNAYGIDIAAQSGAATTNIGLRNAGITSLTNSEASVGSTSGALRVTGGIYAGAASVFGGAVAIGNTVAVAVAAASTHKVTMVIGGVTYYLLASNV